MNQITLLMLLVLAPVAIAGKSVNSDRIGAIETSSYKQMIEECNKSKDVDACLQAVKEEQDKNDQAVNVSGREKTGLKGK